jgi:hypothetical protein
MRGSVDRPVQGGLATAAQPSDGTGGDVFVGREDELGLLQAGLDEARSGRPSVAIVEGAPGIGKTALLRRFLQSHRGSQILSASGDEAESSLPFGVLDQLLAAAGVPAVGADEPTGIPDELQVGARLVQLFGELQAGRPLVVVVEDAHWADQPSLRCLTFTLRRLRADRILTLLTVREGSLPQVPDALQRLTVEQSPTLLRLSGLTPAELRDLAEAAVGSRPSLALAERVREHTNGNPLHARALLHELSPAWLSLPPELPLPSPRSYALLVLRRLAGCPAPTQDLVVAAAVLGVRCHLDDAARLGEVHDPLQALDAAVQAQLLHAPSTPGGEVAFSHPLVRAAVYHDLGPVRRAALHLRAAPRRGGRGAPGGPPAPRTCHLGRRPTTSQRPSAMSRTGQSAPMPSMTPSVHSSSTPPMTAIVVPPKALRGRVTSWPTPATTTASGHQSAIRGQASTRSS